MNTINSIISQSNVHQDWQPILKNSLAQMDPQYLSELLDDTMWLPGIKLMFAAFKRDVKNCQYILFGESPYPRAESANGIAFYDAAVSDLWSDKGLSKGVNKATSLRNIMKTALLAEQYVALDAEGKITQQAIAVLNKQGLITQMEQLIKALENKGFLMLNTAPVLHPQRKPALEARFWKPFIQQLLLDLHQQQQKPTLVLWGKVAEHIEALPVSQHFNKIVSEHPYNLSFIQNPEMQTLFARLQLLTI